MTVRPWSTLLLGPACLLSLVWCGSWLHYVAETLVFDPGRSLTLVLAVFAVQLVLAALCQALAWFGDRRNESWAGFRGELAVWGMTPALATPALTLLAIAFHVVLG